MTTMPKSPAEEEKHDNKRGWYARVLAAFGINSLLFSIIAHLLFGVLAAYLVVEHFQKKHINFQATEPPGPHAPQEHKVQLSKHNKVESAPPDLKRIVTTAVSPISMPDVPLPQQTDETTPSDMSGIGVDGFSPAATTGGGGFVGGNDGSGLTVYGAVNGEGLQGNLYDFKRTPDRQPTDMAETEIEKQVGPDRMDPNYGNSTLWQRYREVLSNFVRTWNLDLLKGYYKSSTPLSTPQICVPEMPSALGPHSFHANEVVPRRWIVVYQGKVMPPESGTYRFIGRGDDFLVVNVNGQNVLDADYPGTTLDSSANSTDPIPSTFCQGGPPLIAGKWFQADQDTPLNIKVLIGENPGGATGSVLEIQKQGDDSPTGDYPIFQVLDVDIPDNVPAVPCSKKKMLFKIVQEDTDQ